MNNNSLNSGGKNIDMKDSIKPIPQDLIYITDRLNHYR